MAAAWMDVVRQEGATRNEIAIVMRREHTVSPSDISRVVSIDVNTAGDPIHIDHSSKRIKETKMIIPKKNRIAVYSYLFKEGVCVAKKDPVNMHPRIDDVKNLEVLCLMKSFTSRGLVKHTYNWRYNYYYLTNEGIEYLREYLHIPAEVVPETLTKGPAKPSRPSGERGRDGDYEGRRGSDMKGERGGYRRGGDREGAGFGRGRRPERD